MIPIPLSEQIVHKAGGAPALPNDGVVNRPAGFPVPQHRGFPLIGDADGCDIPGWNICFCQHFHHHGILRGPDLHSVVLYPALPGILLRKFLLRHSNNILPAVKQNGAGAGGSLIQRQKIGAHGGSPFRFFYCTMSTVIEQGRPSAQKRPCKGFGFLCRSALHIK